MATNAAWVIVYGSSNIKAIRYDEPSKRCYVKFHNDQVYSYSNVSEEEWESLVHADSKGKYVHRNLVGVKPSRKEDYAPTKEEEGTKLSGNDNTEQG